MPLAGFEPKIPVFKRAKTFHALDRATTVTGYYLLARAYKTKSCNITTKANTTHCELGSPIFVLASLNLFPFHSYG
jgi:hypothetical protein